MASAAPPSRLRGVRERESSPSPARAATATSATLERRWLLTTTIQGSSSNYASAVPKGFDVLFDGTGNEVRDQVLKLVRKGGRAVFIVLQGAAPPPVDGVEMQSFAAVVNSTRLQAVAELVAGGRLRMPIETEFPLERARDAMEHVGARHTQGRVVLRIES